MASLSLSPPPFFLAIAIAIPSPPPPPPPHHRRFSCRKRRSLPSHSPPPLLISSYYNADIVIHHKNCAGASFFSTRASFRDGASADGFTISRSPARARARAFSSSFSSSSACSSSVPLGQLSFMKTYNSTSNETVCARLSFSGDMERINTFSPQMSSSSSVMPWLSSHSNKYIKRCRKHHSPIFCAIIGFNHIHDEKGYDNFAPVQIALSSSSSCSLASLALPAASSSPSSTTSVIAPLAQEQSISSSDEYTRVSSTEIQSFYSDNEGTDFGSAEEENVLTVEDETVDYAEGRNVCSSSKGTVSSAYKDRSAHSAEVKREVCNSSADEERDASSTGVSSATVAESLPSAVLMTEYKPKWSMLLSTEALEDAQISRAGSVTDAHVLRRKGRLKEQDGLIEFIISMHATHSPLEVMEKMERWVREHFEDPRRSTLKRLVPSVERFYSQLPLVQALQEYDQFSSLSRRKYVPPNFAEVRHVLNIAQVHAVAENLTLITFDADGTLYADGHHIERDNKMIDHIIKLMQHGAHVAIVTAAGYPGEPERFQTRFAGLLAAFEDLCLPHEITSRFHIIGGECNYLLEVNDNYHLKFVQDEFWKTKDMLEWLEEDIEQLLNDAELALKSAAARLRVPVDIIRKPRAVGVLPKEPTIYEVLEEMALTVQLQLVDSKLPFCAFNGGTDVFVDVGNKSIGMGALMTYLKKKPSETLHVGDRFTLSGNDSATRSTCPILWVANPEETSFYTRMLLRDIRLAQLTPYIE